MKRDDVNLGRTRRPLGDGPQAFREEVVISSEQGRKDRSTITWGRALLSDWDYITLTQQREKAARRVVALPPAPDGYYDEDAAYLNEQARWDRENESWER